MAVSYFKFATPGIAPNPNTNPLSYVLYSGTPIFCTGGPRICVIWASVQILNGVPRPIMTPALIAEINTAVATQVSTANVWVKP
ncbi:hypothetical protein SAMN05518672_1018 [Chitinophaga sp. CF118]|nr:hypothetical protein SAMN05518672_1018 [Chitinophaga sp. CF118]